ncbi:hypothetical protein M427DRAFT_65642 [Gonapodya prolifera JEL478]|uniref:SAC domain-containing protein n=1 Tax=Gonapodya prolifera (strain JEL478) TaxID=1344416 RepID=A0A139AY52_GONPJ|nr:hypothetical protein M427DRAFT_65642 [Gonapodya prolifera JEL478]|eukprot:KXS21649.1 hypothetical protein M427DRAFT_65642 [Gonapodya prolifera JEL478]
MDSDKCIDAMGVIGLVDLEVCSYLVVIQSRMRVGQMYDHNIYRLGKVLFVSLKSQGEAVLSFEKARRDVKTSWERRDSLKEINDKARKAQRAHFGQAVSQGFGGFSSRFRDASEALSAQLDLVRRTSPEPEGKPRSSPPPEPRSWWSTKPSTSRAFQPSEETPASLSTENASPESSSKDSSNNEDIDFRVIDELRLILEGRVFFFSYDFDITRSLQCKHKNPKAGCLWQTVDSRFWWNEDMQKPLVVAKLDRFILPIMEGFVAIEKCQMEGYTFDYILISRRSKQRSSIRFQRRGVNAKGHASSFVETEQIVSLSLLGRRHDASFVQVRGSIPLFWSQLPKKIELKPMPQIDGSREESESAMQKHFDDLLQRYGDIIVVNLVETEGKESVVGRYFAELVSRLDLPQVTYMEWDFHSNCSGSDYRNLQRLRDILAPEMEGKMEYFWASEVDVLTEQKAVFRTNCMDCLDRTNVVQSVIARDMLNTILFRLGLQLNPEGGIKHYADFDAIYCDIWANMGDAISISTTGTAALKGDFTRRGRRRVWGLIQDASNSVTRLYYATFRDPARQAILDYVLGEQRDIGAVRRVLSLQRSEGTEDEGDDGS